MNKRIISFTAAVMLALSGGGAAVGNAAVLRLDIAAAAADADSNSCGEDLTWTLDDGTLTISGTGKMTDYGVVKAPWSENKKSVKKVIIRDGVTYIGGSAFYGCKNLTDITIPDSVEGIGNYAFSACSSLESIHIPNSVTRIDEFAFESCSSLKDINIPNRLEYIDYGTFESCTSLESITIPDSVLSIGDRAFVACRNLKCISFPDRVRSIGEYSFAGCSGLESITFSEKAISIFDYAFSACKSLKSVTVPKLASDLGQEVFSDCTSLESVVILDGFSYINVGTFDGCASLTSVTIPSSVTAIGDYAFNRCDSLESVTIPDSVTKIGEKALGYHYLPDSNTENDYKIENFKICCSKDSAAEKYAADNGFEYAPIPQPVPEKLLPAAIPGKDSVTLEWAEVEGAEKYGIAGYVDGKWTLIGKTRMNTCVLKGLKAGTDYKVAVIAMFDGKWDMDFSNAITVSPYSEEISEYPVVSEIRYSEEHHQFRLTWNAIEGAEMYGVAAKIGGRWKVMAYTDKPCYTSPKLRQGSSAEMVVCARIGGIWFTDEMNDRAFTVTVK